MRALLGRPQQDYYNYLVQSLPLLYVQGDAGEKQGSIFHLMFSNLEMFSKPFCYDFSTVAIDAVKKSFLHVLKSGTAGFHNL